MRRLVSIAAALLIALLGAAVCARQASAASSRVALVIGNSAYQNAAVLANPVRDAQAMSERLKQSGFDVVSLHSDLANLPFKRVLRQFEQAAATAEIAVVFYAGHGIEIRGTNYMIPVDARLANDRDAEDEAITLDRLLQSVEGAKRLGLVILDACRDNPFLRNMVRTASVRAATIGLGLVEPTNRNTLVAYAAKMGAVAEDGIGKNSPYTAALLNHLFQPGLDIRLALGRVRDEVLKSTAQRQEPFVAGSLGGDLIALVPRQEQVSTGADTLANQRIDYALVEKVGTRRAWEAFLAQYPSGFYADLARQQLAKLSEPELQPTRKSDETAMAPARPRPDPPSPPRPSVEEQRAWDRIKDTADAAALRDFIKRYPASPQVGAAEARLDVLERARQAEEKARAEREEKARLERDAKAAETARLKEAQEASQKRAEAERQAKAAAEAAARQKAEADARQAEEKARAEREAKEREAKEREAREREAREREAKARIEREAKAAEAARLKEAQEASLKRAEAERQAKAAAEAAARRTAETEARRAEEERRARLEAERREAGLVATERRADEQRLAALAETARTRQATTCANEERLIASLERSDDPGRAQEELKRLEYDLVCERLRPQLVAALKALSASDEDRWARLAQAARARQEADCKREEELIKASQTAANRGKAREDLRRLEYDLVCERLRPALRTALDKMRND